MLSLRELESSFRDCLFEPARSGVARVVRGGAMAPQARLAIYHNNVFHNYGEALRDVYPVIERLVGEDFFQHAARHYIRRHFSASGDLHRYGGQFAEFLESFQPAAGLPYLGDTARLEWRVHEVFHAAEHAPLSLERLATSPADRYEGLTFMLHPACRLLTSRYPVHRIWEANQPERGGDETVDLGEGGVQLLVHRRGYAIELEALGAGDFALLSTLAAGCNVTQASQAARRASAGFDLAASLRHWIGAAVVVDFGVPGL